MELNRPKRYRSDGETVDVSAAYQAVGALARRLVARCISERPGLGSFACYPSSAIVIEVPDAGWVSPVAAAWTDAIWPGQPASHGAGSPSCNQPGWVSLRRDGITRAPWDDWDDADVTGAMASGMAVHGFSQRPFQNLPRGLWRGADVVLTIPRVRGLDITAVASATWPGIVRYGLTDGAASVLSSDDIWLAAVGCESGEDFTQRLRQAAEGEIGDRVASL